MNETGESHPDDSDPPAGMTARQTYNLVSDTVVGPNVRLRDNVLQGIAILVCIMLGAIIGAFMTTPPVLGVLVGGFMGLVAGFFASGIFLMVYRAVSHMRGRHD